MPIRPENKDKYPKDWKQIVARIRTRAGNSCEFCGVRNHDWGFREGGFFVPVDKWIMRELGHTRPPFRVGCMEIIMIVCTTAHLNHDETDCSDKNLRFLCQRCHNQHDARHRRVGIIQRQYVGMDPLFSGA